MPRYQVTMEVKEISKELPPMCPVHKVGDRIIIDNRYSPCDGDPMGWLMCCFMENGEQYEQHTAVQDWHLAGYERGRI